MFRKIIKFIKNIFIKQETFNKEQYLNVKRGSVSDLKDITTGQITKSAITYNKGNRFLKLKDTDCAIVMHPKGQVEIIFSKLYDKNNQQITIEQETLMSIAIFLKQPGFTEMLRHQFHQIAMRNINDLTNQDNIQKGK